MEREVAFLKYKDRKEVRFDSNSPITDCEYYTIKTISENELDELRNAKAEEVQRILDRYL